MDVRAGLTSWLTRASTLVAVLLVLVGVLFALLEAQSPSRLYWTGRAVTATSTGGIAYYRVDGERWTVDDQRDSGTPAHRVTVYVNPDDPSEALVQSPTRWLDGVAVAGWFVAAAVCLCVPVLRRVRRRRRSGTADTASAPQGERDADWFAQYLDRSRNPRQ